MGIKIAFMEELFLLLAVGGGLLLLYIAKATPAETDKREENSSKIKAVSDGCIIAPVHYSEGYYDEGDKAEAAPEGSAEGAAAPAAAKEPGEVEMMLGILSDYSNYDEIYSSPNLDNLGTDDPFAEESDEEDEEGESGQGVSRVAQQQQREAEKQVVARGKYAAMQQRLFSSTSREIKDYRQKEKEKFEREYSGSGF